MAFGRLVSKFRILKKDLLLSSRMNAIVIMVCARLHNFIIDVDVPIDDDASVDDDIDVDDIGVTTMLGAPLGMCYNPTMVEEDFEIIVGSSQTREALVKFITDSVIRRPVHNLLRNNEHIDEVFDREYFHPN